jgi:hypothetical protein
MKAPDAVDSIVAGLPDIPAAPSEAPVNLPADFWNERPVLRHISDAAHNRGRSRDALLGATLCRAAVLTLPTVLLPAIVGAEASLNFCAAITGRSGAGKSTAAAIADEFLPISGDRVAVKPIGSGEGIVEAFLGYVDEVDENGKPRKVKRQVLDAVEFQADEGQVFAELGSRRGSTLLQTTRTAWSGGRLGQANASEDRNRELPPHSYRAAFMFGFQPSTATALLDDTAGGTPQRFAWFTAEDPTIPDEAPVWPGVLAVNPPRRAGTMRVAASVTAEIRARSLAVSRGQVTLAPLDAHRDLVTLKVAGLLAILESRGDITVYDWNLARQVLDASDRVRSSIENAAAADREHAEQQATRRLARRGAALEYDAERRAREAMARAIARHVASGKCDHCGRRCVSRSTASQHRQLATVDDALGFARDRGWIAGPDDDIKPGEAQP